MTIEAASRAAYTIARARHQSGKRRGRPRRASSDPARDAAGFGVDLSLLTLTLARSPAERLAALEANAALLVEIGSAR